MRAEPCEKVFLRYNIFRLSQLPVLAGALVSVYILHSIYWWLCRRIPMILIVLHRCACWSGILMSVYSPKTHCHWYELCVCSYGNPQSDNIKRLMKRSWREYNNGKMTRVTAFPTIFHIRPAKIDQLAAHPHNLIRVFAGHNFGSLKRLHADNEIYDQPARMSTYNYEWKCCAPALNHTNLRKQWTSPWI